MPLAIRLCPQITITMNASAVQRLRRYQSSSPATAATAMITVVLPSWVRPTNTSVEVRVACRAPQPAAASNRYRPVREVTMSATWPKAIAARRITRSAPVSASPVARPGSKRRRR
jgi:hypothetical protein